MKNIIITSGGTSEYIDKVRKITNSGTGLLGSKIANEMIDNDKVSKIYYICTPKAIKPKENKKITIIEITDTFSLKKEVENLLKLSRRLPPLSEA